MGVIRNERLKKVWITICAFLTISILPSIYGFSKTKSVAKSYNLESLKKEISRIVDSGVFTESKYGILIKSLKSNEVIFSDNSSLFLVPASNMKILTSASALSTLGPEYRFSTKIFCDARPSSGVVKGNIYIVGSGDPELYPEDLWKIASHISYLGIEEIRGDLIVDGSFFSDEIKGKDLPTQIDGTIICGVPFNFNSFEYIISPYGKKMPSISIHPASGIFRIMDKIRYSPTAKRNRIDIGVDIDDSSIYRITFSGIYNGKDEVIDYKRMKSPLLYAGETFKEILSSLGIRIRGKVKEGKTPESAFLFYEHKSRPLSMIVEDMNKFSNNFIADHLFIAAGTKKFKAPANIEKAVNTELDYLKRNNIPTKGVVIKDGSGLSYENKISPEIVSLILEKAWSDFDYGPSLISSLPIMGTDGTLKERLKDSPLRRSIRAKSGYVNKTSSLSGYVMTSENEPIVFSIIINDCNDIIAARLAQDRIVELTSLLVRKKDKK